MSSTKPTDKAAKYRNRPNVGVGVFVTDPDHPNCVLLGRRKNASVGSGMFALPGGYLDFGEEWVDCGCRETLEETGLTLKNARFCTVVNAVVKEENYHHITFYVQGEIDKTKQATPKNLEPNKCDGWEWRDWDKDFPSDEQIFAPLRILSKTGYSPFKK